MKYDSDGKIISPGKGYISETKANCRKSLFSNIKCPGACSDDNPSHLIKNKRLLFLHHVLGKAFSGIDRKRFSESKRNLFRRRIFETLIELEQTKSENRIVDKIISKEDIEHGVTTQNYLSSTSEHSNLILRFA